MNRVSIAGSAVAAIFAAASVAAHAQTGSHPATQSDKPMATPGATSGELRTPRQSSTPGIAGAAASDTGVPNPGRAHGNRRVPGVGKPGDGANVH